MHMRAMTIRVIDDLEGEVHVRGPFAVNMGTNEIPLDPSLPLVVGQHLVIEVEGHVIWTVDIEETNVIKRFEIGVSEHL